MSSAYLSPIPSNGDGENDEELQQNQQSSSSIIITQRDDDKWQQQSSSSALNRRSISSPINAEQRNNSNKSSSSICISSQQAPGCKRKLQGDNDEQKVADKPEEDDDNVEGDELISEHQQMLQVVAEGNFELASELRNNINNDCQQQVKRKSQSSNTSSTATATTTTLSNPFNFRSSGSSSEPIGLNEADYADYEDDEDDDDFVLDNSNRNQHLTRGGGFAVGKRGSELNNNNNCDPYLQQQQPQASITIPSNINNNSNNNCNQKQSLNNNNNNTNNNLNYNLTNNTNKTNDNNTTFRDQLSENLRHQLMQGCNKTQEHWHRLFYRKRSSSSSSSDDPHQLASAIGKRTNKQQSAGNDCLYPKKLIKKVLQTIPIVPLVATSIMTIIVILGLILFSNTWLLKASGHNHNQAQQQQQQASSSSLISAPNLMINDGTQAGSSAPASDRQPHRFHKSHQRLYNSRNYISRNPTVHHHSSGSNTRLKDDDNGELARALDKALELQHRQQQQQQQQHQQHEQPEALVSDENDADELRRLAETVVAIPSVANADDLINGSNADKPSSSNTNNNNDQNLQMQSQQQLLHHHRHQHPTFASRRDIIESLIAAGSPRLPIGRRATRLAMDRPAGVNSDASGSQAVDPNDNQQMQQQQQQQPVEGSDSQAPRSSPSLGSSLGAAILGAISSSLGAADAQQQAASSAIDLDGGLDNQPLAAHLRSVPPLELDLSPEPLGLIEEPNGSGGGGASINQVRRSHQQNQHQMRPEAPDQWTSMRHLDQQQQQQNNAAGYHQAESEAEESAGAAEAPIAARSGARQQAIQHQFHLHDRPFDVAQIQCNNTDEGFERFACPTPNAEGRFRCIEDRLFCDGYYDCPGGEDEERVSCMYYKLFVSHIDILTNTFLNWAKKQNGATGAENGFVGHGRR